MTILIEMNSDIQSLLHDWPFDQEKNIRLIVGDDGRSLMQVRLPLGIEQYEIEGRPDGKRPHGYATVLDWLETRRDMYQKDHGTVYGFAIEPEAFAELQQEGILFYSRYVLLFQINDFHRVQRDTEHNLRLCDMIERYYSDDEGKNSILQFRPYILRMNAVSRALDLSNKGNAADAVEVLDNAMATIEGLAHVPGPAFEFEKARSVNYLQATKEHITKQPGTKPANLQDRLDQAIAEENFELAANLRDQIRRQNQALI